MTKNHRRFNMQIELRIETIQKTFALYVRILNVQMNNKLKWESHVRTIQKKWSRKWWFYRVSQRSREKHASHALVWFIRQSSDSQSFTTTSFDTRRMSDRTTSTQRRHNSWKYKKLLCVSFSKTFESFLWKYWKKKRTFNSFIFICFICKLQFEIDWINTNIEC